MPRYVMITEMKKGKEAEYKQYHDNIWPEVAAGLRTAGVASLRIYQRPGTRTIVLTAELSGVDFDTATGPNSQYMKNKRCAEWENLMNAEFHGGWTLLEEIHSSEIQWNRSLGLVGTAPGGGNGAKVAAKVAAPKAAPPNVAAAKVAAPKVAAPKVPKSSPKAALKAAARKRPAEEGQDVRPARQRVAPTIFVAGAAPPPSVLAAAARASKK